MPNTIPVDIEFVLKNLNFQEEAAKMKAGIRGVTTTAQKEADQITRIYKQMASGIGIYFSARFLKDFIGQIATVRGEFQQLEVSLQTILKDKAAADKLMQQVVNFASTTPFELKDVATGTKQLLAYGFAGQDVIKTFKMLGDVAAGLSVPIGDLIYLYGTLNTQGRAYTRDILQFTSRGIPIIDELAKQFGVAKDQIQGMVQAGEVGFKDVEKAFKSMTGEGGKFNGLIDAISEKIPTLAANYKDAVTRALNGIGKNNEDVIAGSIKAATTLVNHYQEILDVLKVLVTTYGAYKAATIAVAVAEKFRGANTVTELVIQGTKMVQVTKSLTAAQWLQVQSQKALNTVMAVNPYVLVATAVAGLVVLLTAFGKEAKTTEDYVTSLNNSIDKLGKQQEIDQLISQYNDLSQKAKRTADEQKTLNETIQKLGSIFPDAIGKTDQYGKAVDLVTNKLIANNDALRENIRITTQEEISAAQKQLDDLTTRRDRLLQEVNSGQAKRTYVTAAGPGGIGQQTGTKTIQLNDEAIAKSRQEINKLSGDIGQLSESITKGNQKLASLNEADTNKILEPYKALFKKASEYSTQQAKEVKQQLTDLLSAGLGVNADSKIKAQIEAIDQQLGLPTIKQQVADTEKALSEAKNKLIELRSASSQATAKEIEDQKKIVDDLTNRLEVLTGVKQKKEEDIKDIKGQIDKLYKELETADAKDRDVLAAKIVNLQNELALRKAIAAEAIKVAENNTVEPKTVSASSIHGVIKDEQGRPLFIGQGQYEAVKKVELEYGKLNKRIKQSNGFQGINSQLLSEAASTLSYMTNQYKEQLGLNDRQAEVLNDIFKAMDGVANIASGNVIQGAAQLLDASLNIFIQTPEKLSTHFTNLQNQIDKIINSLNIAGTTLSNLGNSDVTTSLSIIQSMLVGLGSDAKDLNDQLQNVGSSHRRGDYTTVIYGDLINRAVSLEDEINKLTERLLRGDLSNEQRKSIEAVLNSYNELMSQIDSVTQEITGTTVKSLSESLAEAFLNGENAAEAWGQKVDDIIKTVIVKQLSAKLLSDPINNAINTLIQNTKDGLTTDEAKKFSDAIQSISESVQPAFEEARKALESIGINFDTANSSSQLTGAVKAITEDTASLVAGQLMGMRIDIKAIIAQIAQGQADTVRNMGFLKQIAANTENNAELKPMSKKLDDIHQVLTQRL